MREKETKNKWREPDAKRETHNKLSFSADKIALAKSSLQVLLLVKGSKLFDFYSQLLSHTCPFLIPRIWGYPVKQTNANKKALGPPLNYLLLKLYFTWNYWASRSRMNAGKQTVIFVPVFWTLLWKILCEGGKFSHWLFSYSIRWRNELLFHTDPCTDVTNNSKFILNI